MTPPRILGRQNSWQTVNSGSASLPFLVSQPTADSGVTAVVVMLPGCGHFYAENYHPLPWQGCVEHIWENLAFQHATLACAWPAAGNAGTPPAWVMPEGSDWTKAQYTLQVAGLLQEIRREVSPHLSIPVYVIGLGAGGSLIYQLACAGMGPIHLPYPLTTPTDDSARVLVHGGRKDVEAFDRNVRRGHGVRGNTRVTPVVESLCEETRFMGFRGYNRTQYPWAPGLTVRQHIVWPLLLSDPDWLLADHLELP